MVSPRTSIHQTFRCVLLPERPRPPTAASDPFATTTTPAPSSTKTGSNDIRAMLQSIINSGGCCVDCLPTTQANCCIGYSKIQIVDNCVTFGDARPKIDQYLNDVFSDWSKGWRLGVTSCRRWIVRRRSGTSRLSIRFREMGGYREEEVWVFGGGGRLGSLLRDDTQRKGIGKGEEHGNVERSSRASESSRVS